MVRYGRDQERGDIDRRRPKLEECGTSLTCTSNGAYPIRLPLELERAGVHADVALHGRIRLGAADTSRVGEILESTPGQQFPRARCGQQRSTLESSGRRERAQWAGVRLP